MNKYLKFISVLLVTSIVTSSPPVFAGGGFSGSGGGGSGEIAGAIIQLTSCPADIVAYVSAIPANAYVKMPSGCTYTLSTSSAIEYPTTGAQIDWSGTTIYRTATEGTIIGITNVDPTKKFLVQNLNCSGAFASICINVDQTGGSTFSDKNNLIFRNIDYISTQGTGISSSYGFKIQDASFTIDGAHIVQSNNTASASVFAIRSYANSTADAAIDFSITNWYNKTDCTGSSPSFCRGLDISYQNATAGGAPVNSFGTVKDFYAYAHGAGEACKQTNDTSGSIYTNEVYWTNGTCDGNAYDFRDGSAFGSPIIAHVENVEMKNGIFSLKSTSTYDFEGVTGKSGNFWVLDNSAYSTANADQDIESFIAYVASAGDTIYFPSDITIDADIAVTKGVHLIGLGKNGCSNITTSSTASQIFNITSDNATVENFCLNLTSGWDGILFNGTGGTSFTNSNVKNVTINKASATGNSSGVIYNDASGTVDGLRTNIVCTTGTCYGIEKTDASTVDAASTINVYNPDITVSATSGTAAAFYAADGGSSYADTYNIIGGKYRVSKTTGLAYGVYASGPQITVNNFGIRGIADDIDFYFVSNATINSNSSPSIAPFTIGGSGPNASGISTFGGGINVPDGQQIDSNGHRVNYPIAAYASGTVYSLTNTSALVDFGTTDPILTIDKPGTYWVSAKAQLKYNAATFAANQTATCKIRRTNNTASDLTNATRTADLRIITTITDNAGLIEIPETVYTTANQDDHLQLWCSVSAAPGAGSVDVTSAEITAKRQY